MDMENGHKEIVEKKVYEEGKKEYASNGKGNAALTLGIIGTALGAGALWGRGNGILGIGGGGNAPENVNIQVAREAMASGAGAPTAFQAWEHGCEEALALTNTIWGLKVNTQGQLGKMREQDIAEKFSLYKGMTEAAFGLYKSQIDADFSLYKNQRDMYDALDGKYAAKFAELDKKVAVIEAVRPYQDRLLMDYTDKKTCRCIYGELVLPSTPTVTGYQGANPFGCNCARQAAAQTA